MSGRSRTISRQVRVGARKTTLKLEGPFWDALGMIAKREGVTVGELLCSIDASKVSGLTATVRCFVVAYLMAGEKPEVGRIIQSIAA